MAFHKEQVVKAIQGVLEDTPIPGSSDNLASAGWVERIIAQQGQVNLILNLPAEYGSSREALKETIQTRILEIDGVDSVRVLEKVSSPAPKQPTSQPSGAPGPVFGAQGIPGVRHIIAVASGKGGVGKSTIAVNLAVELGRIGKSTGLMDSDVYGPSIPKMLGMEGIRPEVTTDEKILPLAKHGIRTISIGFLLDDDSPVTVDHARDH